MNQFHMIHFRIRFLKITFSQNRSQKSNFFVFKRKERTPLLHKIGSIFMKEKFSILFLPHY